MMRYGTRSESRAMKRLESRNAEGEDVGLDKHEEEEEDVEADGVESNSRARSKRRKIVTEVTKQNRPTRGGSTRTREGKKNGGNGTEDETDRGEDDIGISENKRKRGGTKKSTTTTVKAATKKKAAVTTITTQKKETGACSSTEEDPTIPEHLSTQSSTPSALNDRSNIMGRDDDMGRDASGKSSRRHTPSSKQKEWDEMRKNLGTSPMKSPLRSKNLTKPTRKQLPLPIKRRVRIDEDKNQVKEFAIDENGADDGSNTNINTNTNLNTNEIKNSTTMKTTKQKKKSTEIKTNSSGMIDISSIVGTDNNSSNNKIDNIDNDSTTVKSTSPTGAPSLGKNCLSPSSPNLNRKDRKAKKGDDDDDNTDRGKTKKDGKAKKREDDDYITDQENNQVKKKQEGKAKKGDDDDDNNDRENNQVQQKPEAEARAAAAVEQEQRELEAAAAAALQKYKEARAAALQKEKEAREAAAAVKKKDKQEKKTTERGLLISTKASRAVSRNTQLQIPQMFDEINDENKLELIKKIYDELKHPAIKFRWDDDEPITNLSDILFPLKHVWLTEVECRNLMRDPNTTSDKYKLYGGYSHIDCATEFTFSKKDDNKCWCPLPASMYEKMLRNKYEKDGEIDNILNRNQMIGVKDGDLLKFKVIDFLIWGNNHYSRVFVINASKVLEAGYSFSSSDDDEAIAIMIHTNSMVGLPAHDTPKVGKLIRRFLNEHSAVHAGSSIRKYNLNSLPIIGINETVQDDGHTCAYHTIAQRYCMMKTLADIGNITKRDIDGVVRKNKLDGDDSDSDSDSDHSDANCLTLLDRFKYKQSDVKMIKADLKCIVRCLRKIKQTDASGLANIKFDFDSDSDSEADEDDDDDDGNEVQYVKPIKRPTVRRVKKEASSSTLRKKARSDYDTTLMTEKKRRKQVADDRADKFDGKLNKGEHKNYRSMQKQMTEEPPRRLGEGAATMRSYRDEGHRRSLNKLGKGTYTYQRMCRFVSDEANAIMKPSIAISLIFSEISAHPDYTGKYYAPYRKEPQRLCLSAQGTSTREERYKLAKDYYENFDKYEDIDNSIDLDLTVMGDREDDLVDFIKSNSKKKNARNKSSNSDNFENIPQVKSSPQSSTHTSDDEDEDVDEKALS